ncbi:hypothetical protein [Amycolatopsis keratiniphila]|uniref:Uncharacterized protein n=1 Tax=Amycolatopsis keratiniphila subsp. keratiniphila TaxID=227715 RepID=A0A1W2M233_9PSEU|nr:hypothetical protein [Amycolatopsis keratiniphila]ONF73968.1 hypothetical protein AVR91_0204355 [Amycolatopsis keratiniphila subsp. keratiniphila]
MHVTQVTAELERIANARDTARAAGLAVEIPPALLDACAAVIRLAEQDPDAPASPGSMARLLPLRRALWHVLDPGERVTVTEVAARLADFGRADPAHKVSNALGYWVTRGRLERERKGVYLYPETTTEQQ